MKQEYLDIHHAIHDKNVDKISINNEILPIQKTGSGLRFVDYNNIRWMEQNKSKNSDYAKRAREGENITWGIRQGGWILIDKYTKPDKVTALGEKLKEANININT